MARSKQARLRQKKVKKDRLRAARNSQTALYTLSDSASEHSQSTARPATEDEGDIHLADDEASTEPPPSTIDSDVEENEDAALSTSVGLSRENADPSTPVEENLPFPVPPESPHTPQALPHPTIDHQTPLVNSTDGIVMSEKTTATVHPYVSQDLTSAHSIDSFDWLDVVFGVSEEKIRKYAQVIKDKNWFEDADVQSTLHEYCTADSEKRRYKPFRELGNRILELGRQDKVTGLTKGSYPIKDIVFADHHRREVQPNEDHGAMAAKRSPDIVMTRAKALEDPENLKEGVNWKDIWFWLELKKAADLADALEAEKVSRGLSFGKKQSSGSRYKVNTTIPHIRTVYDTDAS